MTQNIYNRHYWSDNIITHLKPHEIFVFGSNPEGRHGKGAALTAKRFGAVYGQGYGHHGQTYAIVTKNLKAGYTDRRGITHHHEGEKSVSETYIRGQIDELYQYATLHPELSFLITYQLTLDSHGRAQKSLNGYTTLETGDMFYRDTIPTNIVFHDSYRLWLEARLSGQDQQFETFVYTQHPGSQWHPSRFVYKDRIFVSGEQFMMYNKAMLFKDTAMAQRILTCDDLTASMKHLIQQFQNGQITRQDIIQHHLDTWNSIQKIIKDYGRHVQGFNLDAWEQKNTSIIGVGNREKFGQNPDLLQWLLNTGDKTLVEAAHYDKIYGIGIGTDDPRRWYPELWQGHNLLGQALMQTREHHRNIVTSPGL